MKRIYKSKHFEAWFKKLKDMKTKSKIRKRLKKIEYKEVFGDTRSLGGGLAELRFHGAPGYRIYYRTDENGDVFLLDAGTKDSQKEDIKRAKGRI